VNKNQIRDQLRKESTVAGDVEFELEQLRKIQKTNTGQGIETITVTCSHLFTLVCCE